jgi:predicted transcriptional regulator
MPKCRQKQLHGGVAKYLEDLGRDEATIRKYIQGQEDEDKHQD